MKQIRRGALALLLVLALLCAGCAKGAETKSAPAADANAQTQPGTAPAPAPEKPNYDEALAAYLEILEKNREAILGYDWQYGEVFDEDAYRAVPAAVPTPVAFADVWGDEAPELVYLAVEEQEGWPYGAGLHVCTWENGEGRELELPSDVVLDGQVGGGSNYRLFQTDGDKGLWIYQIYNGEGYDEYYTHLTAEGAPEAQFTCSHSAWPAADESQPDGWGVEEKWQKLGANCTQESYEAAVPAEAAQAAGLLMRNAMYYEYMDDVETPEGAFAYPQGSAMSYNEAVEYLRGELGITLDTKVDEAAFFASLPSGFSFLSGAGGWSSELYLSNDGTFTGDYHDSDMGDDGEGYPYGTMYVCSFSGRFGNVRRVDEYSYSMHLLELEIDPTPAEEWIEDGVRYVSSNPYGLDNADEIMVYLPGAWIQDLPNEFVDWVAMPHAWSWDDLPVLLPCYGLYNVAGEEGWSGYQNVDSTVYVEWAENVPGIESGYDEFTADTGDYAARVFFGAYDNVKDFKLYALTMEDVTDDGTPVFSERELHAQSVLTPDRPLVVTTVFYGDSPNLGFSYVDGDGATHRFAVGVSGYDGSLVLIEY